MTARYEKLVGELESLRRQAEKLREKEVAEVIAKMKRAIKVYGITAAELGFSMPSAIEDASLRTDRQVPRVAYADGRGNYWGGRGPRPGWLKALLEQGVPLDALRVGSPSPSTHLNGRYGKLRVVERLAPSAARSRSTRPVKFRNEQGQTWSGRGPRPTWLREALREGRSLSEFAVD